MWPSSLSLGILPVSNNMLLIPIRDFTRRTFIVHISPERKEELEMELILYHAMGSLGDSDV